MSRAKALQACLVLEITIILFAQVISAHQEQITSLVVNGGVGTGVGKGGGCNLSQALRAEGVLFLLSGTMCGTPEAKAVGSEVAVPRDISLASDWVLEILDPLSLSLTSFTYRRHGVAGASGGNGDGDGTSVGQLSLMTFTVNFAAALVERGNFGPDSFGGDFKLWQQFRTRLRLAAQCAGDPMLDCQRYGKGVDPKLLGV